MAINSLDLCGDKNLNQSVYSSSSKGSNVTKCRVVKINFSSNGSISSSAKLKTGKGWSPYLAEDRVQMLAQHTEKKVFKQTEIVSSFPMAAKLYKANSTEFKLKKKRAKKSNKKSVLTLPNEPSAQPQLCTVSDVNDSEYFNRDDEKGNKVKKRLPIQNKKKVQRRKQDFEYYDRDAKYCSQVNIDLDCSSTDVIRNFKGDCLSKRRHCYDEKMANEEEVQPHDVWAVLRNINRFQFNPSPPLSEESIELSPRRKKTVKKNKRKTPGGTSVFESCRTEQFSYISSIDVASKSRLSPNSYSPSPSSSIDRITVIDNKRVIQEICEKKPKGAKCRTPKAKNKVEKPANNKRCKKTPKDQFKAICSPLVNRLEEHNTNQASKNSLNKDSLVSSSSTKESTTSHELDGSYYNDYGSLKDVPCQHITTEIECLGSSRSNLSIDCKKDKDKFNKFQPLESHPRMTGPTRVELSKGQELALLRRQGLAVRKPRLVTTMPSSVPIPKSTQTDIRRRLANIKFPLVILGKDQLSATFEVEPYDYPQFNGLDEHIWPFMLAWSANLQKPEIRDCKYSARKRNSVPDRSKRYEDTTAKKSTNFLALNKQALKAKKPVVADVNNSIFKKKELKQIPVNQENNVEPQQIVKPKPIRQLRDKMLKLLYKKTSSQSVVTENPRACVQSDLKEVILTKDKNYKDVATYVNVEEIVEPHQQPAAGKDKPIVKQGTKPVFTTKQARPTSPSKLLAGPPTPPRGKAKWASAFIDNVIKKIKTGVYYNHDINETDKQNIDRNDSKEVSIQTSLPLIKSIRTTQALEDLTPKITIQKKKEAFEFLPGFDEEPPPLEIKTMTRNQIAVKHCVTNVMLQFDVCVPVEHDQAVVNFKRSMSCIPLSVTESKTKVFKCKARIVNAMLPAEICSLIPKMMSKLVKSDAKLALPLVQESDVNNCLSTITELSTCENLDTIKLPLLPHIKMSLELTKLAKGEFPKKSKETAEKVIRKRNVLSMINTELPFVIKCIPKPWLDTQYYFIPSLVRAVSLTPDKCTPTQIPIPQISTPQEPNYCTDLLPYSPKKTTLRLPQTMFIKFLNHMQGALLTNYVSNFNTVQLSTFLDNSFTVNLKVGNVQEINSTVSINVVNLRIESIYNALDKSITGNSGSSKCIEYIKNVDQTKARNSGNETPPPNVTVCKRRKRKYVRLYKKCKSTSHISAEKKSTSLSKITNMDEFFLALGTGKLLSSVLDGYGGRKILSAIVEMKCWITDITPRQALLVLLLTNKKETPNLVRFRPVILQGIAVNRITRASELDMEIEVIERESFVKRSEHEGTPYSFNCVQDNDSLLEELFWIAKTTASDYQKPFDESSEKLLKALLEKRKKLNPSYLRVMARYVGLGLLKSPAKN